MTKLWNKKILSCELFREFPFEESRSSKPVRFGFLIQPEILPLAYLWPTQATKSTWDIASCSLVAAQAKSFSHSSELVKFNYFKWFNVLSKPSPFMTFSTPYFVCPVLVVITIEHVFHNESHLYNLAVKLSNGWSIYFCLYFIKGNRLQT